MGRTPKCPAHSIEAGAKRCPTKFNPLAKRKSLMYFEDLAPSSFQTNTRCFYKFFHRHDTSGTRDY